MFEFARIAGIALLALLAQSPQASQPPSQSQQPPRFRGGTNLVRVDAFATKDGVPVQDLKADDFQIFEDGALQKIDNFEHVVIEPTPGGTRVDPASVSQAIQQAGDPHRRVFVIFLDIEHVDFVGSSHIMEPLIDFMNRVMNDDDLVGVMTPEMGPQQITFGRKTDVIDVGLRKNTWGRRDSVMLDDREKLYDQCFPKVVGVEGGNMSALATEMAVRRREKMVLDSLSDLAHYMEVIRDGRTAVVTVSNGWVLYGPSPSMLMKREKPLGGDADPMPGAPPPVGVGKGGTLMNRPENAANSTGNPDQTECDKDRLALANLDDAQYFRDIIGRANRANVSFYTIDPGGSEGLGQPPQIVRETVNGKARHMSLATLATDTNGIFLLNSNDLGNNSTNTYSCCPSRITSARLPDRSATTNSNPSFVGSMVMNETVPSSFFREATLLFHPPKSNVVEPRSFITAILPRAELE